MFDLDLPALPDLLFWKDLGDALESLGTFGALLLGGAWTYLTFVRQRLALPRLEVTLTTDQIRLKHAILLRVHVTLRNSGSVLVTSRSGDLRLRRVVPLPAEVDAAVSAGFDPVADGCAQVEWPMLAGRPWKWSEGGLEIEPGESDLLCADFFMPLDTEVVEIYFFLANAKKQNLGWTVSRIERVTTLGGSDGQGQQDSPGSQGAATRAEAAGTSTTAATISAPARSAAATEAAATAADEG